MFTLHGPRDKFKTSFYNRFGECFFFENVVTKLDLCRKKLLESFECRFNSLNNYILWTSRFDPRYASAYHLSESEKSYAITCMKREIQSLIIPLKTLPPSIREDEDRVEILSGDDDDDEAMFEVPLARLHTPTRSSTNSSTDSPAQLAMFAVNIFMQKLPNISHKDPSS